VSSEVNVFANITILVIRKVLLLFGWCIVLSWRAPQACCVLMTCYKPYRLGLKPLACYQARHEDCETRGDCGVGIDGWSHGIPK
jgi:hypothetical protein